MSAPATRWEDVYATQTARITELERENAALREDKERLDAIRHGWRISCEEGSAANLRSDRWFIWTRDWSQPIGEGNSLRAAIDAARKEAKP